METQTAQSSRIAEDRPALAFSDPESALRWAKTLPFLNLSQVYEQVIGQLRALSAAEFTPRERATIAELMREQAMHLHTELARRYAGKPQPLIDRELEAADEAVALWSALWEQYSACLKPLLEGDPELTGVRAKILHRGLHVGKQLLLVHGLSRRVPTGTFWQELHAYYRLAEMLDCTVAAVSDDLNPQAVGMSCYSTYVHALLLGLADPFSMSVRQIELLRSLAVAVGAQGVSVRAGTRKRRPGDHGRPRPGERARAGCDDARQPAALGALRLSGQARDERARTPEAPVHRRQSCRAPARPRRIRRAMRASSHPS